MLDKLINFQEIIKKIRNVYEKVHLNILHFKVDNATIRNGNNVNDRSELLATHFIYCSEVIWQMSRRDVVEQKTEELIMPILDEMGFELWDIEYVKEGQEYYLRAYIDKEGGITIDDCVDVSRRMSELLDADEYIDEAYIFEVSSPGLGRKLVKDKEFSRSIGRAVDVKFYKPVDGSKEISGELQSFDKETIVIDVNGVSKSYARADIAIVKLSVEF